MNEKETLANVMDFVENELIKTVQKLRPTATRRKARSIISKIGARLLFGQEVFDEAYRDYVEENK